MTEKRFPLPLSSVVGQNAAKAGAPARSSASSQTAIQNRQDYNRNPSAQPGKPAPEAHDERPLVSDGVRKAMVARLQQQGIRDEVVLASMQAVPRHLFLDSGLSGQAYIDASLPIGHHQTISQPYIVARMLELLRNGRQLDSVLEIGTGCGYQAAVLSLISAQVYSVERIRALHELAKQNLRPMRIANIRLHYGDGMAGMPQVAPFDGIILAAAGLEVPQALLRQMKIGGRLVAPVGGRHQVLHLVERVSDNEWKNTVVEQCHFVPLHVGVI